MQLLPHCNSFVSSSQVQLHLHITRGLFEFRGLKFLKQKILNCLIQIKYYSFTVTMLKEYIEPLF